MSRAIGGTICSGGIFERASFENVFFGYNQLNKDHM
jgi:hypothetical protein